MANYKGKIFELDMTDYSILGLCIHKDPLKGGMGWLVKFMPQKYHGLPDDLEAAVSGDAMMYSFYYLGSEIRRKTTRKVGAVDPTSELCKVPPLRVAGYMDNNSKVHDWGVCLTGTMEFGAASKVDLNYPDLAQMSDLILSGLDGIKVLFDEDITPEVAFFRDTYFPDTRH